MVRLILILLRVRDGLGLCTEAPGSTYQILQTMWLCLIKELLCCQSIIWIPVNPVTFTNSKIDSVRCALAGYHDLNCLFLHPILVSMEWRHLPSPSSSSASSLMSSWSSTSFSCSLSILPGWDKVILVTYIGDKDHSCCTSWERNQISCSYGFAVGSSILSILCLLSLFVLLQLLKANIFFNIQFKFRQQCTS